MKKIEVKYNGIVVGYTYDNKNIQFLDTPEAKKVINKIMENSPIGISSRAYGHVDENGNIKEKSEPIEYNILKINKNDNDEK